MTEAPLVGDGPSTPEAADNAAVALAGGGIRRGRLRWLRRVAWAAAAGASCIVLLVVVSWVTLSIEGSATPSTAARGGAHDAEWLGHAWVDGRKGPQDVDTLAAALRDSGIHDLFVHAGPFNNDGTLDPDLRPRAQWLVGALHAALPGVRIQAWLGAHPVAGELDLGSRRCRDNMLAAVGQILDDGFDGVHLDLEPVDNGDTDLVALLDATHTITRQRHAVLSLSASLLTPVPGMATAVAVLPGRYGLWSPSYLHDLARHVDQVAVMAYDTWTWTTSMYAGYVRQLTSLAWDAVPTDVTLFIGVPAYHDDNMRHHRNVETMASAIHGVRLSLGERRSHRAFGLAVYVDFTATADDWATYRHDWRNPDASR